MSIAFIYFVWFNKLIDKIIIIYKLLNPFNVK